MLYNKDNYNRKRPEFDPYAAGNKKCRQCNVAINDNYKYCPHCGTQQDKYSHHEADLVMDKEQQSAFELNHDLSSTEQRGNYAKRTDDDYRKEICAEFRKKEENFDILKDDKK